MLRGEHRPSLGDRPASRISHWRSQPGTIHRQVHRTVADDLVRRCFPRALRRHSASRQSGHQEFALSRRRPHPGRFSGALTQLCIPLRYLYVGYALEYTATRASGAVVLVRLYVGLIFAGEERLKFLQPDALGPGRFDKAGIPGETFFAYLDGVFEIGCGILILAGLLHSSRRCR